MVEALTRPGASQARSCGSACSLRSLVARDAAAPTGDLLQAPCAQVVADLQGLGSDAGR
jgi:hypothetical protein